MNADTTTKQHHDRKKAVTARRPRTPSSPWATAGQEGHLAALTDLYLKAAAYDAAFNRRADTLDRRDSATRATITAFTAITSLGAFGALFADNPAWWAKVVVFACAATVSCLTALRQDSRWGEASTAVRTHGARWTDQRNTLREWLAVVTDGGVVADEQLKALSKQDTELVESNPSLPHALYRKCKEGRTREFFAVWHPGSTADDHESRQQ